MAKVTIEFDLENPDDEFRLRQMMAAGSLASFAFQILNNLYRNTVKHVEKPSIDGVFDKIREYKEEYGIEDDLLV